MTREEILEALKVMQIDVSGGEGNALFVRREDFDRLLDVLMKAIEINERNHKTWFMYPEGFIERDRAELLTLAKGG